MNLPRERGYTNRLMYHPMHEYQSALYPIECLPIVVCKSCRQNAENIEFLGSSSFYRILQNDNLVARDLLNHICLCVSNPIINRQIANRVAIVRGNFSPCDGYNLSFGHVYPIRLNWTVSSSQSVKRVLLQLLQTSALHVSFGE